MLRKLLLIQLFLLVAFAINAQAQIPNISPAQASQINVDNLTDDQIRKIVADMKQNNLTMDDIDLYAQQKGVPQTEVDKLKSRITQLGLDKTLTQKSAQQQPGQQPYTGRKYVGDTTDLDLFGQKFQTAGMPVEPPKKKIYGEDLFKNKNLTFEPNLRMATPPNYKLATDDQVLIDVYGYSEVQYNLTVTAEGYIRIPNLGPIYVNGLTMEEAKNRITKQLSTIYSTISSGKTMVQVSLGNIRSIKVLLIGEVVNPGSYTLPSLATVANALYVSGGPDENGSFRNIQVIRNGRTITTFDLYDFIFRGDLSNNVVLQDQDIVRVNAYKTRVELIGEVKRPAIFEAKENETITDVLNYAGGFTDNAYKDKIIGYRITNKEREIITIPADQFSSFRLRSGDQYVIDSVLNRYTNRATITGAVFRPGEYAVENGMTLLDLIKKADGVKEVASLNRGLIRRLKEDYTPSMINFNVQDIIAGRTSITLEKEDSVVIYSKLDLRPEYLVHIEGEVNKAGDFPYAENLKLEDLILMAGGLTDAASLKHVEISRRVRSGEYNSGDASKAIVTQMDITADLKSLTEQNIVLEPFDEVTIRRSPGYSVQANMRVEGEVVYPGQYTIESKKERISEVIKRAGGLKAEAFPEGAVLLRRTYITGADSALLTNKLEMFYSKLEDSTSSSRIRKMTERNYQLLGIKLEEIINKHNSKYDLLVEEGDIIKIPKKLQTVQLFGEIYFPKKIRFDSNINFKDYIRGAGGFTGSALKRRSYVVYANGDVKGTRKVLFFNKYPTVKPGAEVYIPSKKEKRPMSGGEIVGITSGIASVALIIVTLLNKL